MGRAKPSAVEVPLPGDASALLAGFDFGDAYAVTVDTAPLTAEEAARMAFVRMPAPVGALMRLRDFVVRPLGLKASSDAVAAGRPRIGFFPVISSSPERVVMGFDDVHLNFRVVVDVASAVPRGQRVTASTLVKRHNRLGRVYLAAVMPFHRAIVPMMLARLVAAPPAGHARG